MKINLSNSVTMEQYTVLHITKFKELGGIGAHLDRQYVQHNVDDSRSHLNEEFSPWGHIELNTAIENRIQEGYEKQKTIRHDAVLAVGVMLTGSHEQMKKIESDPKLFNEWKQQNYKLKIIVRYPTQIGNIIYLFTGASF
jgi:hypothetical protein